MTNSTSPRHHEGNEKLIPEWILIYSGKEHKGNKCSSAQGLAADMIWSVKSSQMSHTVHDHIWHLFSQLWAVVRNQHEQLRTECLRQDCSSSLQLRCSLAAAPLGSRNHQSQTSRGASMGYAAARLSPAVWSQELPWDCVYTGNINSCLSSQC